MPVKYAPFKGLLSANRLLFGNHKEKSLSEPNSLRSCKSHRIKLNLIITYGKCLNIKQRHQHFLFRIPLSSEIKVHQHRTKIVTLSLNNTPVNNFKASKLINREVMRIMNVFTSVGIPLLPTTPLRNVWILKRRICILIGDWKLAKNELFAKNDGNHPISPCQSVF